MADKAKGAKDLPQVRTCGTERVHLRLLLEVPEYAERRAAIENHAWRMARMRGHAARTGCTQIPVVVHVVHRTSTENVSQAQIDSQITVLNDDFRRRNADIGSVPAAFQPLTADSRIEFVLATTDPNGNATNGVTRTQTTVNGFTDDDAVKSAASGGADAWPADQYLNIWVCRLAGGLLGYAQFPGGPAATDGVVVTHTGFGTTGTAAAPFDRGRTTVHEIGHWLNLRHIWGDDGTGCSGSDFVADTPNQAGFNVGTPAFPRVSCSNGPNGDMFMNYMDYVDDVAMMMFTTGQVDRMQAALDGPRSTIGTAIPCQPKTKFADEPLTLKFRDDGPPKLKVLDDPATLKFRDDPINTRKLLDDGPKLKVLDDPINTRKLLDDGPKLKILDDPMGTSKLRDEPFKGIEDVKLAGLDKGFADEIDVSTGEVVNPAVAGSASPFILATPHHSRAWEQAGAGAAQTTAAAYEQQLAEYEQFFEEYARAEAAGEVGEREREAMETMYAQYTRLAEEYQQLGGGQA